MLKESACAGLRKVIRTRLSPQILKTLKEYPIKEHHLFVKAYQKGRKSVKRTIVVYVLPDYQAKRIKKENPEKKTLNRLGFSVSKKNGGAVQRNRCKRIMREAYRQLVREKGVKTGFLLVIAAREECASQTTKAVLADMTSAFAALNLFPGLPAVFPSDAKRGKSNAPKKISH